MLKLAVIGSLALAGCVSAPAPGPVVSAGYESPRIADANERPIQLDIWYPTDAVEQTHNYNFGIGRIASGGAVTGKDLPVVLLSHGAMGAASNYSWIAEPLARHGYIVLGVSHFGESAAFGPATSNPASISHFGDRTRDFGVALDFLVSRSAVAGHVDPQRLGALGHSSGGATVLMLAGASFSAADIAEYCSEAQATERGCRYPVDPPSPEQAPVSLGRPIRALALMDPAVGPGFAETGLGSLMTPTLVIGSVDNDFLTFAAHAGRFGDLLGSTETIWLEKGEGHFVFLDRCNLPVDVMGVKLCSDRAGVDREAVHAKLATAILSFFDRSLAK